MPFLEAIKKNFVIKIAQKLLQLGAPNFVSLIEEIRRSPGEN